MTVWSLYIVSQRIDNKIVILYIVYEDIQSLVGIVTISWFLYSMMMAFLYHALLLQKFIISCTSVSYLVAHRRTLRYM